MTTLAEMKKALEAATPGPWYQNPFTSVNVQDRHGLTVCSMAGARAADAEDFQAELNANAHLIANAPDWLAKLIAVAEAAQGYLLSHPSQHENAGADALTKALEELK